MTSVLLPDPALSGGIFLLPTVRQAQANDSRCETGDILTKQNFLQIVCELANNAG